MKIVFFNIVRAFKFKRLVQSACFIASVLRTTVFILRVSSNQKKNKNKKRAKRKKIQPVAGKCRRPANQIIRKYGASALSTSTVRFRKAVKYNKTKFYSTFTLSYTKFTQSQSLVISRRVYHTKKNNSISPSHFDVSSLCYSSQFSKLH